MASSYNELREIGVFPEADFAEMVTLGIFETNADAKKSYDELASAIGKVYGDGSVSAANSEVNSALRQAATMHGII